ncbi:MAG: class I SAM-dependent methyltransferase, partial [Tepidiformaceae bacterium]
MVHCYHGNLAIDLGTGDGSFVLRAAQADPGRLWVGIDPVAASMAKTSTTAIRSRAENAIFVLGSVESLPAEFEGLAGRVTVNLPWGSLLRAVAAPAPELLCNLSRL